MDKNKTPHQAQIQGEWLEHRINKKISDLLEELRRLENRRSKVLGVLSSLDDPHALIPKDCKTFEDWLIDHPFPYSCIGMIYKNKAHAERVSYCCYNYQEGYHVIPCESKDYYKEKYKELFS